MPFPASRKLRRMASELLAEGMKRDAMMALYGTYGIKLPRDTDKLYVDTLSDSLRKLPPQLVRDCGISLMGFTDLGPSKEYYPNHGKYLDGALVLNIQLLNDPFLEVDIKTGSALNKFDQILYHEMGHGWDERNGSKCELSLEPDWMGLSGWSKKPKPGLKKIVIKEAGCPTVEGEYFFSPDAGFVRYYGKRNPWDDFADTFSYYVGGMKSFIPENKCAYFDTKLSSYFGG